MSWTTLRMRVATPLFNTSAEPHPPKDDPHSQAGVWVPSIRGAMRFWFRALAGGLIGPRLDDLFVVEEQVFGSSEKPSQVRLRIPEVVHASTCVWPHWLNGKRQQQWIGYLLGQGLYHPGKGLRRRHIGVGTEFDLQVRLPEDGDVAALALAALWLTSVCGGIGARVRRGFGGVRIIEADGDLPWPWTADSITTPAVDWYTDTARLWPKDDVLGKSIRCLRKLAGAADVAISADPWGETPPTYPVFSRRYTFASLAPDDGSWTTILARAGEHLRRFRASQPYPDARYRPEIKTPEWEQVIHGRSDRFTLGALGLPVGYRDGYFVHADRDAGQQTEKLRRASPLWLRVVGEGDHCRRFSFAFRGEYLPDSIGVHVWHQDREKPQKKLVRVEYDDVVDLTTRWIEAMRAGEQPNRA